MRDVRVFEYYKNYKVYIELIFKGWRIIICTMILVLVASSFYILTLPSKLEVAAKIKMPRFSFEKPLDRFDELSKEPIKGINLASNFQELDYLCDSQSNEKNLDINFEIFFASMNKNSLVEVIFYEDSEDLAKTCLSKILSSINESQSMVFNDLKNQFLSSKLEEINANKERILEDERFLTRIKSSKEYFDTEYKLTERIRSLEDLNRIKILEKSHIYYEEARYLNNSIIFKRPYRTSFKFLILFIGLISGAFLGAIFLLIRYKIIFAIGYLKQFMK